MDVYLEALTPNTDFTFSIIYKDLRGHEATRDDVHMTFAEWMFVDASDQEMVYAKPIWKEALLAAANSGLPTADYVQGSYFKSQFVGLPQTIESHVNVQSEEYPTDQYEDTLVASSDVFISERYGVMYSATDIYGADPDAPLTSIERQQLLNVFGVQAVHNPDAMATLATGFKNSPTDIQRRRMRHGGRDIKIGMNDDLVNVGQTVSVIASSPFADENWVWEATTSDGQTFTDKGQTILFFVKANQARDLTVTVKGGLSYKGSPVPPQNAPENSSLIRIVAANTVVNEWVEKAWKQLRFDVTAPGTVPGDPLLRNRRISELYAALYNSNTAAFKWAGNAAFASHLVGDAMADAWKAHLVVGDPPLTPDPKVGFDLLAKGNLAVYDDLYPQHLAFQAGGLAEIQKLLDAGLINQGQRDAWKQISDGLSQANKELVWNGNEALLKFEQQITLQTKVYDVAADYFKDLTNTNNPFIPAMRSPIPGDNVSFQDFRETDADVPDDASIGDFSARWEWIIDRILVGWRNWDETNGLIDIDKLLKGGYDD